MAETEPPPPLSRLRQQFRRLWGGEGLAARGKRASVWSLIGFGSTYLIRLGSNLALTRLLSPEIFGLMALANVFMQGLNMLSDVGVRASVVRSERGDEADFLNTAWTVQVLRGVIIAAISCAMAYPLALVYEQPILFPLIIAVSLSAVFLGFVSISVPLANRKLDMKLIVMSEVATKVLVTAITISAAWLLESVWALAIGAVFGAFLGALISHIILPPHAHRFRLERPALREIITYGRWILVATACTFLANEGQQALYGLLIPVELLGQLAIAILIASVPLGLAMRLLTQVIFPSFSEIRRDRPQDTPRVLRKVRLVVIFAFLPVMFLISYFAQPIIDLLYDERYALAGLFLALLPLNNSISILTQTYQNLLLADGESRAHALLMILVSALTIAGIVLGNMAYGLMGSIIGVGIAFALHLLVNSVLAHRRGYGTGSLDLIALALIIVFYVFTMTTLDVPEFLVVAGANGFEGAP